jgi:hypothetical protein
MSHVSSNQHALHGQIDVSEAWSSRLAPWKFQAPANYSIIDSLIQKAEHYLFLSKHQRIVIRYLYLPMIAERILRFCERKKEEKLDSKENLADIRTILAMI